MARFIENTATFRSAVAAFIVEGVESKDGM